MPYYGCHLSISKGFEAMGKDALFIGADTFAFFPRNPRGGQMRPLDGLDIQRLTGLLQDHEFGPLVAHAPYIYNMATGDPEASAVVRQRMKEDLERLDHLPYVYYNIHPGAHVGQGQDQGAANVAGVIQEVLSEGFRTPILLETMAGKGTELGGQFENLDAILSKLDYHSQVGVCLDTCHVSDAGYDVAQNLDGVLDQLDQVVGLDRLWAVHVNDSKNPVGSHKDRHELLGDGTLGLDFFRSLVQNPRLQDLPMILETPNKKLEGYKREIAMLRAFEQGATVQEAQARLEDEPTQ